MIDDRPDDNVFRVNRAAFTDANTFDREMSQIFDRCWLYIGHESQKVPTTATTSRPGWDSTQCSSYVGAMAR